MTYRVDASDLGKLAAAFRAATPAVKREYRKGLKDAGRLVADDAARRVAPYSPPTAASMKVGTRGVNRVVISAGKGRRIAALLEGDGTPGTWRHPLFGDDRHWYVQQRHPYLRPAWEAKRREAVDRMGRVIRDGLAEADIRSEER